MGQLRGRTPAVDMRTLAVLALVAVTAIWGSTFVIIKETIATVDPSDFLFFRFLIASLVLVAVFGRRLLRLRAKHVIIALAIGGVYGLAQLLQTWGLANTAASISGFLTGAYVVFTPFIAFLVVRARISGRTVLASLIALAGIAVLSVTGFSVGGGEALTLVSALVYALHIVLVGMFARHISAIDFTTLQMIGITGAVGGFALRGGIQVPSETDAWAAILYTALFASIGVLFLQSWAQRFVAAATTAVVMALEPIFATFFAVLLGGEAITGRLLLGGLLIVLAILISSRDGSVDRQKREETTDPDVLDTESEPQMVSS